MLIILLQNKIVKKSIYQTLDFESKMFGTDVLFDAYEKI